MPNLKTPTNTDSSSLSTSTSTSEPDKSTPTSEPSEPGASPITAGAAAGIGVGAAAGVIAIALLAFFWVYRRKKSTVAHPPPDIRSAYPIDTKTRVEIAHPRELDAQPDRSWRELEG